MAVASYVPALWLPFIADDYFQIPLARGFAAAGWVPLWQTPYLASRAAYMWLSASLDSWFGFHPMPFYAASILLHVACVLLLYAAGVWSELNETIAFWAAGFFAIHEGHQEAVMWLAASYDLLVFLFGMVAWLCWIKRLQGGSWKWYAGSLAALILAFASKEAACVFPFLMLIPALRHGRRAILALAPHFMLVAAYLAWTLLARVLAPAFHDIRFSLSAPFALVAAISLWRLLVIWGLIALAVIFRIRGGAEWRRIGYCMAWMLLGLGPHCFLLYMNFVPSRQTYIASAGLALLVGIAAWALIESNRRTLLAILTVLALAYNLEILWVKKMAQFRERAEPSELLKSAGTQASGPVYIECVPLPEVAARGAVESVGRRAVFRHPGEAGDPHCFDIEYQDVSGNTVHLKRRLGLEKHGAFY